MPLTLQKTYDTVLFALRKQKVISRKANKCCYRGSYGRKCAAGHLIPDDQYKPEYDATDDAVVDCLILQFPETQKLFGRPGSRRARLIRRMQGAHDWHMPEKKAKSKDEMRNWELSMKDIASDFRLKYTEPS